MRATAVQSSQNKSFIPVNNVSRNTANGKSVQLFADNRPETVTQRKLKALANIGQHTQPVAQLQALVNYAVQRQKSEEEELLQGRFKTVQRKEPEEEEPLQGKFKTIQRQELEEEEPLQGKFQSIQKKGNNTGLPDNLKNGIENLSGMGMDDVKVHYNSDKPAGLQAHAYAQGTDIHVAPGQEKHLPHEAWHVVQQKQGRVKPTMQMKGSVNVNDDKGLEKEADVMGEKALTMGNGESKSDLLTGVAQKVSKQGLVQRAPLDQAKLNVAGESHGSSDAGGRRTLEKVYTSQNANSNNYWTEKQFGYVQNTKQVKGDPDELILEFRIGNVVRLIQEYKDNIVPAISVIISKINMVKGSLGRPSHIAHIPANDRARVQNALMKATDKLLDKAKEIRDTPNRVALKINFLLQYSNTLNQLHQPYATFHKGGVNQEQAGGEYEGSRMDRSIAMFQAAANSPNILGVWKVGNNHKIDISKILSGTDEFEGTYKAEKTKFNNKVKLLSKQEFVAGLNTWLGTLPASVRQSLILNKGVASIANLPQNVKDHFGI